MSAPFVLSHSAALQDQPVQRQLVIERVRVRLLAAHHRGERCRVEESLAASISLLNEQLLERTALLKTAIETMRPDLPMEERMRYCAREILTKMNAVREIVDKLETLVAAEYWPYPTYYDLLFSV